MMNIFKRHSITNVITDRRILNPHAKDDDPEDFNRVIHAIQCGFSLKKIERILNCKHIFHDNNNMCYSLHNDWGDNVFGLYIQTMCTIPCERGCGTWKNVNITKSDKQNMMMNFSEPWDNKEAI